MKKIAMVLIIGLCVGLVGVFAEHPGGTGVGVLFRSGYNFGDGGSGLDVGLSLKLASVPVYWGLFLNIRDSMFGVGGTGDYYVIDRSLIQDANFNLGWHLGLGGYATALFRKDDPHLAAGGRIPVGLSLQFAKNFEAFLNVAYNLGLQVLPKINFPAHFFNGELGVRLWIYSRSGLRFCPWL
ncbi:MAG: hypothetical protein LBH73_07885 [Spirochaetaceae bacterium]|jgi:hypothetical protein|nr:hypothetical protein [Spirochaetaceae bacterium]